MLKPWFLQSKPKIIFPERAPDDFDFGRGTLPDDLVADLPWVSEFDLLDPVDRRRLRQVLRASTVKGQTFIVRSATDAQGEALATFSDFPTGDAVAAAVAEPYGRGPYGVWSTRPRPQLIRTFYVQGPARRPSANSRQQDHIADLTTEIKAALLDAGYQYLRDHTEMFAELSLGLLCKEIGVQVPEMPSFEEEIVNEAMRDPDYRDQEAARVMESRKAEAERIAEFQKLDDLLRYLKKVKRIVELMGYERGAKPSTGAGLDEVMKTLLADGGLTDIVQAFKNLRHPRNTAQAPQASPDGEPPHTEEQPKAENGAHSSPVAEHLPPDTPPQSPASQESPVMEKPGGGSGPQRFDVGVPADSLGLLGLRGDTTFVDWPLV